MLEFLRESLMCSSEDSPKREAYGRSSSRLGLCCGGTGGQQPRRRGEVISSAGEALADPPNAPAALPWDHQARAGRSSSPLRTRGRGSSPMRSSNSSFRTSTSSFHSTIGMGAVPYSGAAMGDSMGCGGLYVPMQRGLGPRGSAQRESLNRPNRGESRESRQRNTADGYPQQQHHSSNAPVRFSVPATSYEAVADDPLDRAVEGLARQLPVNSGKALLMRRLSHAEYEVDGRHVRVRLQGHEVIAMPSEGAGSTELFASYLLRAADHALARALRGNAGSSDNRGDAQYRMTSANGARGTAGGSFVLRSSENGSFLLNRSEGGGGGSFASLSGGSFYGVYPAPSSAPGGAAGQPHNHQQQQQNQVQRQPTGGGGSFYMRPGTGMDRSASHGPSGGHLARPGMAPQPRQGGMTPPMPSLPRNFMQGPACSPPAAIVYAPQYITAGGA
mmetsp:Transcript_90829/g.259842  ORF Transcript_90829/g.259842 Transcript_90829/m.259842 type:complete len:445 (+) Transcript_90829:75-1409(+)